MFSLDGAPLRYPHLGEEMARSIRHRGPEGRGLKSTSGAVIGADRLRIVDPTERADQPFVSPCGRFWLVANGEIYNSHELRDRFPRYPYRSRSDIESLMPLLLERGLEPAGIDGQFAIVAWEEPQRRLTLIRDRAGEKPLFYAVAGNEIVVASEIQTLLLHPDVSRDLDELSVAQFFHHGYVLEPRTLYSAIRRVPAGTKLVLDSSGVDATRYWEPENIEGRHVPDGSVGRLDALLNDAVARQARPGPVGVFWSGGLDSTLLVALLARQLGPGVPTFTARFTATSYDESHHARSLSKRFGTEHTEVLADSDALARAFDLAGSFAEPISDPALLPTLLLSECAGSTLKVVMSGEGADELFGGYPTYLGHRAMEWYDTAPGWVRRTVSSYVRGLAPSSSRVPLEFLLKRFVSGSGKHWIERHADWFGAGAVGLLSSPLPTLDRFGVRVIDRDSASGAGLLDYLTYLGDQLLVKLDRATMKYSLEARSPFLDQRLSEFAFSLPPETKLRGVTTKWLLKRVGLRYLPANLVTRRKQGLSVPIADLINGRLQPEVDALLSRDSTSIHGYFREGRLRRLLYEHRSGIANHARELWTAIVFQHWYRRWIMGEKE